jgi:hypothetical protein
VAVVGCLGFLRLLVIMFRTRFYRGRNAQVSIPDSDLPGAGAWHAFSLQAHLRRNDPSATACGVGRPTDIAAAAACPPSQKIRIHLQPPWHW